MLAEGLHMFDTAQHPMGLYGVLAALVVIAIVFGSWLTYLRSFRHVQRMLESGAGLLLHVDREGEISPHHAARGHHIPLRDLERRAGELPHGRIIVVCAHDRREASAAMRLLRRLGFRVTTIADENLALVT